MIIKTTEQIRDMIEELVEKSGYFNSKLEGWSKNWIVIDDEVKEALSLYYHLKNHTEVQEASKFKGMPCCKICNKSAYQIMAEEWSKLIKDTQSQKHKKEGK